MSGFDLFGFAIITLAMLSIAKQFLHLVVGVRNDYLLKQLDFKKFRSDLSTVSNVEDANENIFPKWKGFRNFVVARKIIENSNCISIHITPQDGNALFQPRGGQFITIRAIPAGFEEVLVGTYSLSDFKSEDDYRITIKKRESKEILANYLCDFLSVGDIVQCTMPAGDFILDQSERAIVFIAGGIGITPILTMLQELEANKSNRQIYLFWGVSALGDVILSEDFENLKLKLPKLSLHLFISQSGKENKSHTLKRDESSEKRDKFSINEFTLHKGRISRSRVEEFIEAKDYITYLCGPELLIEDYCSSGSDENIKVASFNDHN